MPYEFEILLEFPDTPEAVYDMEVKFKGQMDKYHYEPVMPFNGSKTECYTELTQELKMLLT